MCIKKDAAYIIEESIKKVMPDEAVIRALHGKKFDTGKLYVVAVGKAAWRMAKTASEILKDRIYAGVVCTKYDHVKSEIKGFQCFEGGHPVPDKNSYLGTQAALDMVSNLSEEDTVLFLLSGGSSALFEKPLIREEEMAGITQQLLACGADITEINTLRKRLSAVKGGKFAQICKPAHVYSIILSDVPGDSMVMIGSGPAYPDKSTSEDALKIVKKYGLCLSREASDLLRTETPKELSNVENVVTGSVGDLCRAAADACRVRGYEPVILTEYLDCQAKEAGSFMASIARSHQKSCKSLAFIAGGETVVQLTGDGKGGRNQELALSAAVGLADLKNTAIFSIGSDGTDGPTDAAGGYCDGETKKKLDHQGIDIFEVLKRNDAYNALKKADGLIRTGATGTNVNDVAVLLIKR